MCLNHVTSCDANQGPISPTGANLPPGQTRSYLLCTWRGDAALRRAFAVGLAAAHILPRAVLVFTDNRGFEPQFDEVQNPPIHYSLGHHGQQFRVRDAVKGNPDTLPITRIFLQASPSLDRVMPSKVSASPYTGSFIGRVVRSCSWSCPTAVDRSFRPNGRIFTDRSAAHQLT